MIEYNELNPLRCFYAFAGYNSQKMTPQKWVKVYQMKKPRDMQKGEWKNKLKAKAQQLFPQLGKKLTLKICDAFLIAEYARRTHF